MSLAVIDARVFFSPIETTPGSFTYIDIVMCVCVCGPRWDPWDTHHPITYPLIPMKQYFSAKIRRLAQSVD